MARLSSALALFLLAPLAFGQEADPGKLEAGFRKVAQSSIPRTVLIKAIVDQDRVGVGSGAVISPDGLILTCTHVVELGKKLEVVTPDGTARPAKLLGLNKRQDYALIQIEAKGLDAFPLGDSKALVPGDWVVALGHPGGPYPDMQPTFAAGQIRGTNAQLVEGMMGKFYDQALVTDVPIFSGNSGGPLVNMKGELVGINAAIIQLNELAFAIPVHEILASMDDLKAGKQLAGAQAGPEAWKKMQELISPEDFARMQRKMFDRILGKGGRFGDLFRGLLGEDSPLGKMFGENGGQPGEMPDMNEMMKRLFGENGGGQPGEAPDFGQLFEQLQRALGNGEMQDPQEMLRRLFGGGGEQPQQPAEPRGAAPDANQAFLGLRAAQGSGDVHGVLVDDVVDGGPAHQAGVRKGDLVRAIDGRDVKDFPALRTVLSGKKPGDAIVLGIERPEMEGTVLVQKKLDVRVTLGSRQ